MSTQTPADPPEWITGPPPGYEPPPLDDLRDPAVREAAAIEGADLCREALWESIRLRKVGDAWTRDTTTASEGTER